MRLLLTALCVVIVGCESNTTVSPAKTKYPFIGTWHHQRYLQSLESVLNSYLTFSSNYTFSLREDITPLPSSTRGIRYLIPDSVNVVTLTSRGHWMKPHEGRDLVKIEFIERFLSFDNDDALFESKTLATFFWDLINTENPACCLYAYALTDSEDLVFFFDRTIHEPATYFTKFGENGSLFEPE